MNEGNLAKKNNNFDSEAETLPIGRDSESATTQIDRNEGDGGRKMLEKQTNALMGELETNVQESVTFSQEPETATAELIHLRKIDSVAPDFNPEETQEIQDNWADIRNKAPEILKIKPDEKRAVLEVMQQDLQDAD